MEKLVRMGERREIVLLERMLDDRPAPLDAVVELALSKPDTCVREPDLSSRSATDRRPVERLRGRQRSPVPTQSLWVATRALPDQALLVQEGRLVVPGEPTRFRIRLGCLDVATPRARRRRRAPPISWRPRLARGRAGAAPPGGPADRTPPPRHSRTWPAHARRRQASSGTPALGAGRDENGARASRRARRAHPGTWPRRLRRRSRGAVADVDTRGPRRPRPGRANAGT